MALICPKCKQPNNLMHDFLIVYIIVVLGISLIVTLDMGLEYGLISLMPLVMVPLFLAINSGRRYCDDCYIKATTEKVDKLVQNDEYVKILLTGKKIKPSNVEEARILNRLITNKIQPNLAHIRKAVEMKDYSTAADICKDLGFHEAKWVFLEMKGIKRSVHNNGGYFDPDQATYLYSEDFDY